MWTGPVSRVSAVARLLRVVWVILGPLVLLALLAVITQQSGYSVVDVWFAVVLAIVALARLLDIWKFEGTTTAGERATRLHFAIYTVKLLVSAAGGWLVAHALRSGQ
jgi:hypothetical protein